MSRLRIVLPFILFSVSQVSASDRAAFLVGSVDGGIPRQEEVFLIKVRSRLVLSVVLTEAGQTFSPVKMFDAHGERISIDQRPLAPSGITWYLIKPKLKEYSNLWKQSSPDTGDIHLEPIEYESKPIVTYSGQFSIDVSEAISGNEPGTFYIGADIDGVPSPFPAGFENLAESSPLHRMHRFRLIQIVRREDDSYLGYLMELFGTPFVIGPRMTEQGVHETDARMGSDCAAFAIYGKRRQGYQVPFCGPLGIYRFLSALEDGPLRPVPFDRTEVYAAPGPRLIRIGRGGLSAGDIVHFGEQVSIFYADVGIKGVLDRDDLLLQCFGTRPVITAVKDSGFYHLPVRLFRWRADLKKTPRTNRQPLLMPH